MGHPPNRWKSSLVVVLAVATMVGCQGFSSGKPATQSAPVTSPGDLTAAPASITFGNVQVGTSQTLTDTVSNTGGSSLTISQATPTGTGFAISGLTVPATLAPGQSATFNVTFSPTATGAVTGNVALTNDGSGSPLNIALSGTAVAAGSLVANPTSMNLGSVQVGASQSQSETLTNTGSSSLTLTQATFGTAAGFSYTGLSLPITLAPNQSAPFAVVFAPAVAGTANSILSITVSGSSSTFDIALSGTGTLPAVLTASPSSLTFSGVQVGKSQTQTETVSNTGGASVIISQVAASGTGFNISGATTPITVAPGQSTSFSVVFAPKSSGSVTGSVTVTSNASDSSLVVGLSGSTATSSQGQLSVSPSTIGVGSVTVGTSGTQTASLIASGASVTVSGNSVGSSEFAISGLSFPFTLSAGQSANFTVTFSPQSSGAASTTISFTSNAINSPATATVTGTGVAAPAHAVNLGWTASSSPDISGYNVYRRTGTSGSFSQINSTLDGNTSYVDTTVVDGQTYYYEVAAVNSSNEESPPSSAVQAVIPPP
jgi:hypothetical protein